MTDMNPKHFTNDHPRLAAALTSAAALLLVAVIVLFAWNSFAMPVLDLARIQFKEALGLTLLLAVVGRLLVPGRRHTHGGHRAEQ